jgi:hypothetical protein
MAVFWHDPARISDDDVGIVHDNFLMSPNGSVPEQVMGHATSSFMRDMFERAASPHNAPSWVCPKGFDVDGANGRPVGNRTPEDGEFGRDYGFVHGAAEGFTR